jgi:amino acid adenylation domain-containing protein
VGLQRFFETRKNERNAGRLLVEQQSNINTSYRDTTLAITDFLKQLHQKNIQLSLDENSNLRVIADKGALDDATKAELRKNKTELVDWLKSLPQLSSGPPSLPPLTTVDETNSENGMYPLSHAQQRLWFVDQLEKGSTAYTIAAASKIQGDIDSAILSAALGKIVARHESLRTCFGQANGEGYQKIAEQVDLDFEFVNLIDCSLGDQVTLNRKLQTRLSEELAKKFDLTLGALLRVRLYQLAKHEHVLFIGFHHIISDGWSNNIFLAELAFYYNALLLGDRAAELPLPDVQYKDFSVWQRQSLAAGYQAYLLKYWQPQLDGWEVLNLPHDHQRTANVSRKGGKHVAWIEPNLAQSINTLSQQQSVTVFTQLLSIFYVLMYKVSGQTDICIGTDVANRSREEVEGIIGFFVNQLVLRANLSTHSSYCEFLSHVREMTLEAYQHQDLPFDVLVDELLQHHDLAHSPFFPVKFIMQNTPGDKSVDSNWAIEEIELPQLQAKFEMTWSLTEHAERGIEIIIEYDNELFDSATIENYSRFFCSIAKQVVDQPNLPISAIGLSETVDQQRYRALNRFQEHVVTGPNTLSESVEAYAESLASNIAVKDESGSLSYSELNRKANQLANVLRELYGIQPEANVGVCLTSGLDYVTTMVALSKLGAVLVPIDIRLPAERAASIVDEAEFALIISESSSLDALPAYELNFIGLCCLDEIDTELENAAAENLNVSVSIDQLAYIIFTSGTTGKPKGVMVSHRGVSTLAAEQQERFSVTPQDRVLQFASIGFDASMWEVFMALFHGASLYCRSKERLMPGPELVEYINRFGITHLTLPPSALAVMRAQPLRSVKALILASEACNDEVLTPWLDSLPLYNAYGPSEATVCATIADLDVAVGGFNNSIGQPIAGTDVFILDTDGQLAPAGFPGELCIGGISLSRGYWQDPKQTADKFIADNFSGRSGERLYRSGDKARYTLDGAIEFLGRIDQQVKLRGYRIELQEIENQLLKIEHIQQAVVVMHKVEPALYAFVVSDRENLDQAEIKNQLRSYLPEYMIPKLITKLTKIPTNINGKLELDDLPMEEARQHSQNWQQQELNQRESQIHAIWIEVLNIQGVGKYDTFFDVGGYSLLLIKMQELLQQRLAVTLDVSDLFKYPTIAALAEFIDRNGSESLFDDVDERLSKRNRSSQRRSNRRKIGASA